MNKILNVVNKFTSINMQIEVCKAQFVAAITDMESTLEQRWNLFSLAPDYLKEHESYIINFTFPDGTRFECFHDAGYEKYSTNLMVCVVAAIRDREFDSSVTGEYDWDAYEADIAKFPDSANVIAFKEHILKNNLGSFTVDW
jgi:hypothetical protein